MSDVPAETFDSLESRGVSLVMATLLSALFWFELTVSPSQSTSPTPLVAEQGINYSLKAGILELRGGRGWLRTKQPHLNFRLAFEFKAITPDADPGVFVRTWVSTASGTLSLFGYLIRLPTTSGADPAAVVVSDRRQATVIERGQVVLHSLDEWQSVEISGEGSRIALTLNGASVGVFGLEEFGGYILFTNRQGRVQFRNLAISSTEGEPQIPSDLMTVDQFKKAGGHVIPPKVVRDVKPFYTMDAMRAAVQGVVVMDAVVLRDGSIGAVRVTHSLHPDLDVSAIAAVRAWQFEPATVDGQPVPLVAQIQMSFTLK